MAVTDDDRVLAVRPGDESRTHGERLPAELGRALEAAGVTRDRVDLLAVATGPGAFTGLRIGLAAMQGLAMTLNKPVIGVSALDALAEQTAGSAADLVLPWMDAQRGDAFATVIDLRTAKTLEPPTAGSPQRMLDAWRIHLTGRRVIFVGDAVDRDRALIGSPLEQWELRTPAPLAPQIARLAHRRALLGESGAPHALTPIYVRRPDAEIERDHRRRPKADPERNIVSEGGDR